MSPDATRPAGLTEVLTVDRVSKSYGRIKALREVSLVVRSGEFVGLLGPNGAGKSTLFQLLTGLFVPDSGTIRIYGHDIRHSMVPALSRLGVVFQQPTLDPELSVAANLRYHARLHGMGRRTKRRIQEELARLDLTDRARDRAGTLSGGNRRRVELARALLPEPEILLMDEPTVGLDPGSRQEILDYVLRLRTERNIAVLWATHLVDEAEHADRILVMHRGEILRDSTPDKLVRETETASLHDAFLDLTGGEMPVAAAS